MNWRNVRLVLTREIRDQLRDRRTLFMIAVLPILLYPLVGMTFIQLKQFMREHKTRVLVIGRAELDQLGDLPPLFDDDQFAEDLVSDQKTRESVQLIFEPRRGDEESDESEVERQLEETRQRLKAGEFAAVVHFPPHFGAELDSFRQQLVERASGGGRTRSENGQPATVSAVPRPAIIYSAANERSTLAYFRLSQVLHQWSLAVGRQNLRDSHVPLLAARPFELKKEDVARGAVRAAVWAKILPFVVFVWALTGAFYPAVDLCAGEKERGTLETLLASPASRAEIVWGKLFTVMIFSMMTAVLNLLSLGATGQFVISQLKQMPGMNGMDVLSLPPWIALLWLLLALIPISALFSAVCLALAALARSTREGQYYLLPVLMVTAPLMILAISPGIELDLGKSLIPVSGLVLLLRTLIEGEYRQALPFVAPVLIVTAVCCLLAIRWAVEQFSRESVLFRESERFDLRRWLVHAVRDRDETPSATAAFACVVLIMLLQFFMGFALAGASMSSFADVAKHLFTSQVATILMPALLLTLFFSRNRLRTLLLDRSPALTAVGMAVLLAGLLHPVGHQFVTWIQRLYPPSSELISQSRALQDALGAAPSIWLPFLLIAILPAFCEELAFRGFVLSGFRRLGHKWWAIGLSALFFGIVHQVVQQSISAAALGLVLGFLAVQSGSLIPCIVFHATYNALMLASVHLNSITSDALERVPSLRLVLADPESGAGAIYQPAFVAVCAMLALSVLLWFGRLGYQPSPEEQREETRHRRTRESLIGEI